MKEMYKFEPKDDITIAELVEVIKHLQLSVPWELYSTLSVGTSRHFEKDESVSGLTISTDNFIPVDIDISEEDFIQLATVAHEKDITLNNLCNDILQEQVDKAKLEG